ncbi:hypothetical protein NPIL_509941 [Nephila pilipes]|uniref:Uncharacterized protein n=1 Tax=Nephila pilipes TaxID=299642 RepID=A0A8X6NCR8_NEPPI|nr:hypothetical protein NPIL_509941 [Nephila pilipes]
MYHKHVDSGKTISTWANCHDQESRNKWDYLCLAYIITENICDLQYKRSLSNLILVHKKILAATLSKFVSSVRVQKQKHEENSCLFYIEFSVVLVLYDVGYENGVGPIERKISLASLQVSGIIVWRQF